MSVVADSSIIVALLIDSGPQGVWAELLVAEHTLFAPELLFVEATNSLRRLELSNRITTTEANLALADLMQLDVELLPFQPFADRIWELRKSVTSYDAWYVAAAEALDLPLATLDKHLANSNGPKCKIMIAESP